jgi:hypothetical protein
MPATTQYSLRSFNFPTYYVRDNNDQVVIGQVSTDVEKQTATFKIVPGLANAAAGYVSFESVDQPGYYLRHSGFQFYLHQFANDDLFKQDATFHEVPGLADNSWSSFESINYPGRYMRHRNFVLYLESGSDNGFYQDATFHRENPLWSGSTNTPTATATLTNTPTPTASSVDSWWNNAYAFRRTLTVGNAGAAPMPAGRPIMVILNNTTTPTAQDIYNASQTSTKGSDLRVVWRGQTMMPLSMFAFTPNDVQFYFPLQQDLAVGATSGSDYTIYYGNPNPDPAASDINAVFPPAMDANTIGLWHFQESQGFTAYDTSGYGNHVSIQSTGASWGWENVRFLGSYIRFSNQPQDGGGTWLEGSGNGLNPAQLTVEAWILETSQGVERTLVARRAGSGMGWQLFLQDGKPSFEVNYDRLVSNVTLAVNQWYHVAGTYDGQSLKVYLNGSLIASKTTSATMPGTSGVLRIGKHGDTSNYFNGAIQHVRVSNIARTTFPAAIFKDSVTPPNIALGTQEVSTP